MILELQRLGWTVDLIDLGDGFPRPSGSQREAAAARLSAVGDGKPIVVDGLAFGLLPDTAEKLREHKLLALVHHPLALETGLAEREADALRASETRALKATRGVIVTSDATARTLVADYAVPGERITVARPGSDRAAPARGSSDGVVRLLAIGSLVPRKGYDVLIAALAMIADLPWRLIIAGDRTRDPATAARIEEDILRYRLGGRIAVLGAVAGARLPELYAGADLFVLASRYEGYGMAVADAIAHGLPVVAAAAGAIVDTAPVTARVLVPPGDPAALAAALRRLIMEPAERERLAAGARAAAAALPTWSDSAKLFAKAVEAVA